MPGWPQRPMLARAVPRLPGPRALPGGCVYEPKFDGYRALLFRDERTRLQSRRGHDITDSFPEVVAAAARQVPAGTVLDGELVVWGEQALDFSALQRRLGAARRAERLAAEQPASLVLFDVLAAHGDDLRRRPLADRRRVLEGLAATTLPPLELCPQTDDPGTASAWLESYASASVGIEGLVVKGRGQRYRAGERAWLKLRLRETTEAVVGAVVGTLEHPDRLVLGLPDRGGLVVAGGTTPLSPAQQDQVRPLLQQASGDHPWPTELPTGRTARFESGRLAVTLVDPSLVVEISADTAFEYGKWRHLVRFVRPRPDLSADDVSPPAG